MSTCVSQPGSNPRAAVLLCKIGSVHFISHFKGITEAMYGLRDMNTHCRRFAPRHTSAACTYTQTDTHRHHHYKLQPEVTHWNLTCHFSHSTWANLWLIPSGVTSQSDYQTNYGQVVVFSYWTLHQVLTCSYRWYPGCCVPDSPKRAGYNFCGTTQGPVNSQPNALLNSGINGSTSSLRGWQLQSHHTYGTKRDHLALVHQNSLRENRSSGNLQL